MHGKRHGTGEEYTNITKVIEAFQQACVVAQKVDFVQEKSAVPVVGVKIRNQSPEIIILIQRVGR